MLGILGLLAGLALVAANWPVEGGMTSVTLPAGVARGDLFVGQGAPAAWARQSLGPAGSVLTSNGTDALWRPNAGAGDLVIDASAAADDISLRSLGADVLRVSGGGVKLIIGDGANAPSINTGGGSVLMNWGEGNTVFGPAAAGQILIPGAIGNTLIGSPVAGDLTTGMDNVCLGSDACTQLTTGIGNTVIGTNAGVAITDEDMVVLLGYAATSTAAGDQDGVAIGANAQTGNRAVALGSAAIATDDGFMLRYGNANRLWDLGAGGGLVTSETFTSASTGSLGWSIVAAANQACTTTCTSAAVMGFDTAAGTTPVGPSDATADICLCAGAN